MPLKADEFRTTLHERYGVDRGEQVFVAMRAQATGPFGPGRTLHPEHLDFAEQAGVPPFTKNRSLSRPQKPMVGRTNRPPPAKEEASE